MTRKAGIYVRISLDDEGHGHGVARQEEDSRAKCEQLGWEVVRVYSDNSVSASRGKVRPAYSQLLADLEARDVDAVVVYDLDRLTRRPVELESFIEVSDRLGVALANVAGDVDLTTADGRMVARIKGAVARQEAERIGERVRRQKLQRAQMGKTHNGGVHRLFGYDRSFAIIEGEAALLRDAFRRAASGESATSITNEWNSQGIRTSAGNPWRRRTLQDMLKRPAYAGLSAYKGEVVGKTEHAAIVDEALWRQAQTMMDKRTAAYKGNPGRNARRWLLSGIAVCGRCMSPMYGSSTRGGVYRCVKNDGGCGSTRMKATWLDYVAQYETDHEAQKAPLPVQAPVDRTADLAAIDSKLEDIRAAVTRNEIALADALPLLAAERAMRMAIVDSIPVETPDWLTDLDARMNAWLSGSVSARRVIIGAHIKHLVVHSATSPGRRQFDASRVTIVLATGEQRIARHKDLPSKRAGWAVSFSVKATSG